MPSLLPGNGTALGIDVGVRGVLGSVRLGS